MISILPKPVELSHERILKIFKYQEPEFYSGLFDKSEKGPFEVPPDYMKVYVIIKTLHVDPGLYFPQ